MRKVEILKGKEIDEKKIAKVKRIASLRYDASVYDSSYWSLENVNNLAELHSVKIDDEILVLGEDWFLCYTVTDNTVEFLEWVALNNVDDKFIQTIEMMKVLKKIFLHYADKSFTTSMRHNGSYPFYINMLKRGYFNELSHSYDIDICNGFAPERLKYLEDEYLGLSNFLNSKESINHPEYLTFILHNIEFTVTDTFIEQCKKLIKKS